ncbi:MAG: AAA family ATPase [Bacteroidetes bacterium]|nr:AAA family ATPase [Bacteroidota bacterium]
MKLQTAQRKRAKIKLALQGPSGSGKTYSSLLIANGLCPNWSKIVIIDTENGSADLYAHLGAYNVLSIPAPFTPEKYIQAIELCEKEGMEVIIIDSVTHEWENLIDFHSSLQGNSFTNWGKITPRHNAFVQKLLQSQAHIIATIRTKQDYVLNDKNGKMVPEKVGLKSVQRDGLEYEFTLVFDLDMRNNATASKDRTGLFYGKPEIKLGVKTGVTIKNWCERIEEEESIDISERINDCRSIQELLDLYKQYPQYREARKAEFEQHKRKLILQQETSSVITNKTFNPNGTNH